MEQQIDQNADNQKREEFPIEEFDGVDDWSARAWERIKRKEKLEAALARYPLSNLDATYAVLNRTGQDKELRDAIAKEIERRIDAKTDFND